ncbi:CBS domain-containing protein [Streptomyces sp. JW3]|uniref:CBS domain-containing protein n=1 Tax=Streptomyces sp. JW3 TaxID=3456955 RepID=UPI003FA439C6
MTTHRIRDVMPPAAATVEPAATVTRAAELMREHAAGHVLVAYDRGLFGVLTARDIVLAAVAGGRDPDGTRVGSVCPPPPVVTLTPEYTTVRAAELLRRYAVRRVPVVTRGGDPVGSVGLDDLAVARHPSPAGGAGAPGQTSSA